MQPAETFKPSPALVVPNHLPIFTVEQFASRNPAFTAPALRNLIFKAEPRLNAEGDSIPANGLIQCGALLRIGRKVLIHEERFFEWLDAQQVRK